MSPEFSKDQVLSFGAQLYIYIYIYNILYIIYMYIYICTNMYNVYISCDFFLSTLRIKWLLLKRKGICKILTPVFFVGRDGKYSCFI